MEDVALRAALEKLAEAEIVLLEGLPPNGEYRFKHALIQDVTYENLLKSRAKVLHRPVAELLRDYSAACCTGASNFSSTFGGDIGRL